MRRQHFKLYKSMPCSKDMVECATDVLSGIAPVHKLEFNW